MAPDYKFLIPILQRINAHNRKVSALEAVLNVDSFTIDILNRTRPADRVVDR